jgi:hypothetical protein
MPLLFGGFERILPIGERKAILDDVLEGLIQEEGFQIEERSDTTAVLIKPRRLQKDIKRRIEVDKFGRVREAEQ